MKQLDTIFYENKQQSENICHRYFYIDSFSIIEQDIILKGQYIRGIPFNDELTGSHYIMPGKMLVEILCKKASITSPAERKSDSEKLSIFDRSFLGSFYTICFEDAMDKYYEIKCKDFYIIKSEGFYNISNQYISVSKYREMEKLKNQNHQ